MKHYSISETAKLTGCTESVLRIWEQRYRWPRSKRLDNGYRAYSELDVDEIKRATQIMKDTGKKIGELITDGFIEYKDNRAVIEHMPKVDFSKLARPLSKQASGLFDDLIKALSTNNISQALYIVQLVTSIRPSERKITIAEPIREWIVIARDTKRCSADVKTLQAFLDKNFQE